MNEPRSQWDQDEYISPLLVGKTHSPREHALRFKIPDDLPFRRLYLYLQAQRNVAGANYVLDGEINLIKGGNIMERIKAGIGQDTMNNLAALVPEKSVAGITASGQSFGADAIQIVTSKKFADDPDAVIINPHHLLSDCDEISYSMTRAAAQVDGGFYLTAYRVFIGIQSSNHAF